MNMAYFSMRKALSIILAIVMIYEVTALPLAEAQQLNSFWLERQTQIAKPILETQISNPKPFSIPPLKINDNQIVIPAALGQVVEKWSTETPNPHPQIIHVQDIHSHFEAQLNIAEILVALKNDSKDKKMIVALEGAWSPLDLSLNDSTYDEAREQTTRAFLERDYISGPHYFGMNQKSGQLQFIGVENKDPYLKNLLARDLSAEQRERMIHALVFLRDRIDRIGRHLLPRQIREFELNRRRYDSGELDIKKYVEYLYDVIARPNGLAMTEYPQIKKFLDVEKLSQTVPVARVGQERENLLAQIVKGAPKEDVSHLLSYSVAFKEGRVNALGFHKELISIANKNNLNVPASLHQMVVYLKAYDELKTDALVDEVRRLSVGVGQKLSATTERYEDLKQFLSLSQAVDQQKQLWRLELTPQIADQALNTGATLNWLKAENFLASLENQLAINQIPRVVHPDYPQTMSQIQAFYQLAMQRDRLLVSNLKKYLEQQKATQENVRVVLVTGGFHTPGITKLLQTYEYPYVVVQPMLSKKDLPSNKVKILGDLPNPWDLLDQDSVKKMKAELNAVVNLMPPSVGSSPLISNSISEVRGGKNEINLGTAPKAKNPKPKKGINTLPVLLATSLMSGVVMVVAGSGIDLSFPVIGQMVAALSLGIASVGGTVAVMRKKAPVLKPAEPVIPISDAEKELDALRKLAGDLGIKLPPSYFNVDKPKLKIETLRLRLNALRVLGVRGADVARVYDENGLRVKGYPVDLMPLVYILKQNLAGDNKQKAESALDWLRQAESDKNFDQTEYSVIANTIDFLNQQSPVVIQDTGIALDEYVPENKSVSAPSNELVKSQDKKPVENKGPPQWKSVLYTFVAISFLLYLSFVGLPYYNQIFNSLIPQAASVEAGLNLAALQVSFFGVLAWFTYFTANVVTLLSGLVVITRFSLQTHYGQLALKKSRIPGRVKLFKQKSNRIVHLPLELIHTMYSFGFERIDRLYDLERIKSQGGELTSTERWFDKVPMPLQAFALPFFATSALLSKRLALMMYSAIGSTIIIGVAGTILTLTVGPSASVTSLSMFLNMNLLELTGWVSASSLAHGGIASEGVRLFSVFGILSSLMLAVVMNYFGRAKMYRKQGVGFIRSFYISSTDLANPNTWKQAGGSAFGLTGIHMVGLEIAVFKWLGSFWEPINHLVMSIEGEEGVIGAGQQFTHRLLSPFGVETGQITSFFSGTGGLSQTELQDVYPLQQEAKRLGIDNVDVKDKEDLENLRARVEEVSRPGESGGDDNDIPGVAPFPTINPAVVSKVEEPTPQDENIRFVAQRKEKEHSQAYDNAEKNYEAARERAIMAMRLQPAEGNLYNPMDEDSGFFVWERGEVVKSLKTRADAVKHFSEIYGNIWDAMTKTEQLFQGQYLLDKGTQYTTRAGLRAGRDVQLKPDYSHFIGNLETGEKHRFNSEADARAWAERNKIQLGDQYVLSDFVDVITVDPETGKLTGSHKDWNKNVVPPLRTVTKIYFGDKSDMAALLKRAQGDNHNIRRVGDKYVRTISGQFYSFFVEEDGHYYEYQKFGVNPYIPNLVLEERVLIGDGDNAQLGDRVFRSSSLNLLDTLRSGPARAAVAIMSEGYIDGMVFTKSPADVENDPQAQKKSRVYVKPEIMGDRNAKNFDRYKIMKEFQVRLNRAEADKQENLLAERDRAWLTLRWLNDLEVRFLNDLKDPAQKQKVEALFAKARNNYFISKEGLPVLVIGPEGIHRAKSELDRSMEQLRFAVNSDFDVATPAISEYEIVQEKFEAHKLSRMEDLYELSKKNPADPRLKKLIDDLRRDNESMSFIDEDGYHHALVPGLKEAREKFEEEKAKEQQNKENFALKTIPELPFTYLAQMKETREINLKDYLVRWLGWAHVGEGEKFMVSNVGDRGIAGSVFLYDVKVEAEALLAQGKLDEAAKLILQSNNEWPRRLNGYVNSASSKEFRARERTVTNGPNMQFGLTALKVWAATGGNNETLLNIGMSQADFILEQINPNGSIPYGPEGAGQDFAGVPYQRVFNPEYQIGSYGLLKAAARISGEEKYQSAADKALDYLMINFYDKEKGMFWSRNDRQKVDYPLDVPGWAMSMVGPEVLASRGVDIPVLVNDLGRIPEFFVPEWLVNRANGLKVGIKYLESKGMFKEASQAKDNLRAIEKLLFYLPIQRESGKGLAYAYRYDEANKNWVAAEGVPTGWGWNTQVGSSRVSASYLVSYILGHDPVSDEVRGQSVNLKDVQARKVPVKNIQFVQREKQKEKEDKPRHSFILEDNDFEPVTERYKRYVELFGEDKDVMDGKFMQWVLVGPRLDVETKMPPYINLYFLDNLDARLDTRDLKFHVGNRVLTIQELAKIQKENFPRINPDTVRISGSVQLTITERYPKGHPNSGQPMVFKVYPSIDVSRFARGGQLPLVRDLVQEILKTPVDEVQTEFVIGENGHLRRVVTNRGEQHIVRYNTLSEENPNHVPVLKIYQDETGEFKNGVRETFGEWVRNPVSNEMVATVIRVWDGDKLVRVRKLVNEIDQRTGEVKTNPDGHISYRDETLIQDKEIRVRIDTFDIEGQIYSREEVAKNEKTYFDTKIQKKIKDQTGVTVEIPLYTVLANDKEKNAMGTEGKPFVFYEAEFDDISDHKMSYLNITEVNFRHRYDKKYSDAPLPPSYERVVKKYGIEDNGKDKPWVKVTRASLKSPVADPWGGPDSALRPDEVEDPSGVMVFEYQNGVGSELQRTFYPKNPEGTFYYVKDGTITKGKPTEKQIPTQVGQLRFRPGQTEMPLWNLRGQPKGKANSEGLLKIEIERRSGQRESHYEDIYGRKVMIEKNLDSTAPIVKLFSSNWVWDITRRVWVPQSGEFHDAQGLVTSSQGKYDPDTGTTEAIIKNNINGRVDRVVKDLRGNFVEKWEKDGRVKTTYDPIQEDIMFRMTGLRIGVPLEKESYKPNGEMDKKLWKYEAPTIEFDKDGNFNSYTQKRNNILFAKESVVEKLELGPFTDFWKDRTLNFTDIRPAQEEILREGAGKSRMIFKYNKQGVQFRSIREEYGLDGKINLDATQESRVSLDRNGRPVVAPVRLRGFPEDGEIDVVTVLVRFSLGDVYVEQKDINGRARRRFDGPWQDGKFISARPGPDHVISGGWIGGHFIPKTLIESTFDEIGENKYISEFQTRMPSPIPSESKAYRVKKADILNEKEQLLAIGLNGDHFIPFNVPYEESRNIFIGFDSNGDIEFVSRHEELLLVKNGGSTEGEIKVNRVWEDIKDRDGRVHRHYEGVMDGEKFIRRTLEQHWYDSIFPGVPKKSKSSVIDEEGNVIKDISDSAAWTEKPVIKPGHTFHEIEVPVGVIVSEGVDKLTGNIWQEARDISGRIRIYLEGHRNDDGDFVPVMSYIWRFVPEEGSEAEDILRPPNVPLVVEIAYFSGFSNTSQSVPVSKGEYLGIGVLPEGKGLKGKWGILSETTNIFIGARKKELRDARGFVAQRWDYRTDANGKEIERIATYDYIGTHENKEIPYGVANKIEIREENHIVRKLLYDHVEEGYVVYKVESGSDEIEYGLEYVGYGRAGMSFEDHRYPSSPQHVRVYSRQSIPIYSVTRDFHKTWSLYKTYDPRVVQQVNENGEKNTFVVVEQEEPEFGLKGFIRHGFSTASKWMEQEGNPLKGAVWGVIKNGGVIYRQEGVHRIIQEELTTWYALDHYLGSPAGKAFRPELGVWAREQRELAQDEKWSKLDKLNLGEDDTKVFVINVKSLIPKELKKGPNEDPKKIGDYSPGEYFKANINEIFYYTKYFLSPLVFLFIFWIVDLLMRRWIVNAWWSGRQININQASKNELESIPGITTKESSLILSLRSEYLLFKNMKELALLLKDNKDLADKLKSWENHLRFAMHPLAGIEDDPRISQVDINNIADVVESAKTVPLAHILAGLPRDHVLFLVAPQILVFLNQQLVSDQFILAVLNNYSKRLQPNVFLKGETAGRILSGLTRQAYWNRSETDGIILNPALKQKLESRVKDIFITFGIYDDEVSEYVDNVIIKELEGLGFVSEALYVDNDPIILKSIKEKINIPINDRGFWIMTPLEDEVIKKIIRKKIPYVSAQSAYEEFLLKRIATLIDAGQSGLVGQLLDNHARFFYRAFKQELNDFENMRDVRTDKVWDYAFTWEEFTDVFRYLQGKSEWRYLPEGITRSKKFKHQVQMTNELMEKLDPGTTFSKFVHSLDKMDPTKDRQPKEFDQELKRIIKTTFEPLIAEVRGGVGKKNGPSFSIGRVPEGLGLPKVEQPVNQSLFTMRSMYYLMTVPGLFARFLGDNRASQDLKVKLAIYFWAKTFFLTAFFVGFLVSFVYLNFALIPVFVKLNYFYGAFRLSPWFRFIIALISLSPLWDAVPLTYLAITNLLKGREGERLSKKYDINHVKVWSGFWASKGIGTDARKSFAEILNNASPEIIVEFQLFINNLDDLNKIETEEVTAWNNVIELAKEGNLRRHHIPEKMSSHRIQERMKRWINKQYRKDMPRAPRSWAEMKSFTFQISGWNEDFWFNYERLLEFKEGVEMEHRLGVVAKYFNDEWEVFVSRMEKAVSNSNPELKIATREQAKALRELKKYPTLQISKDLIDYESELAHEIEEFVNTTLGLGYNNIKTSLQAREVYAYYVLKFFPHLKGNKKAIDRLVNEKLQFILKHDGVGVNLEKRMPAGVSLEKILSEATASDDPEKVLQPIFDHFEKTGAYKFEKFTNMKQFRHFLLFFAKNNVELKWWKPGKTDVHGGAKYTQWANFFSDVRGEITIALDWDMGHFYEELFSLPNVGREFDIDPTLGVAPYNAAVLSKNISPVAKALAAGQEGWEFHEKRVKDEIGAVGLYGRGFFRTQFGRDLEILQDEYVAEDIESALKLMQQGTRLEEVAAYMNMPFGVVEKLESMFNLNLGSPHITTKYIGYFQPIKNWPNTLGSAMAPVRKWAGDSPESLMGATPIKFLLAPNVHWTKKLDTTMSFAFFLKKPRVTRYLTLLAFIHYAFPLNPLTGLAFTYYLIAVLLGQAISYGGVYNRINEYGRFYGWMIFIFYDMPFSLMPFFMNMLPHHTDTLQRGYRKYAKFIPTLDKGGPNKRATAFEIYVDNGQGIRLGVFVGLLTMVLSPFDPGRLVIWFFLLGTVVYGWVIAPFYLNPNKPMGKLVDRLILGNLIILGAFYFVSSFSPILPFTIPFALGWYANVVFSATFLSYGFYQAVDKWRTFVKYENRNGVSMANQLMKEFLYAFIDNNTVHAIRGVVMALIDLALLPALIYFGMSYFGLGPISLGIFAGLMFLDKYTGLRLSPYRWYAIVVWALISPYKDKDELKDIATNHFAGFKVYVEGRLSGSPSFIYVTYMLFLYPFKLVPKYGYEKPVFVKAARDKQQHWTLVLIDAMPIDWLLLFIPFKSDMPKWFQGLVDWNKENFGRLSFVGDLLLAIPYIVYLPVHMVFFIHQLTIRFRELFFGLNRDFELEEDQSFKRLMELNEITQNPEAQNSDAIKARLDELDQDDIGDVRTKSVRTRAYLSRIGLFSMAGLTVLLLQDGADAAVVDMVGSATSSLSPVVVLPVLFGLFFLYKLIRARLTPQTIVDPTQVSVSDFVSADELAATTLPVPLYTQISKSISTTFDSFFSMWKDAEDQRVPVTHVVYIKSIDQIDIVLKSVAVLRRLRNQQVDVVYMAPQDILGNVQERVKAPVLAFNEDLTALIKSISESSKVPETGNFHFLTSDDTIENSLKAALARAAELQRSVKVSGVQLDGEYGDMEWARVLISYYVENSGFENFLRALRSEGKSLIEMKSLTFQLVGRQA